MNRKKLLDYEGTSWDMNQNERYGTVKELKEHVLYKRIVEWKPDYLKLEDGTIITIEMSESDCCAYAGGTFGSVELDAAITDFNISEVIEGNSHWGEIENRSTVTLFHNQNPVAQADMDAGHNGYYYSVGSLVIDKIHFPVVDA